MEQHADVPEKSSDSEMVSMLRRASLEWRNKYNIACIRLDSIWNDAVHESMSAIGGEHNPPHVDSACSSCWGRKRLIPLLRLDQPPYIPMKERMLHRMGELEYLASFMSPDVQQSYLAGLSDARAVVEDLLDDRL
jgi:hypothetical protein